jgi:glycosyltransferase involved in cell wall biosynthesis
MRICVAYDCLFPYTVGGAERWYRKLAERLAEDGHEVTYLTLRQWERGARLDLDPRVRVVTAGPRLALYTKSGRRRIVPPLIFGAGVLWHLLRHGRRYDVLHTCSFPYFSLLAAAAARRLGRGPGVLVVDWIEVWSAAYWRSYLGAVGGRLGLAVQRLCARVEQRAFCFSERYSRRLAGEGLRTRAIVPGGLYTGMLEPAAPRPAEPLVVFAGRLIPEKRAPLAVAAFALASQQIPALRGELFGDGPEREALRRAIVEHGVQDRASAPGFVDEDRVGSAIGRALCMLSTSSREGYGMVVMEASASATPSVVVEGEDNAAVELVEDGCNGFVAPDARAESIAAAIVRVHEQGLALRERTAAWFARNAERQSLEHSLRSVLASYAGGEDAVPATPTPTPAPPPAAAPTPTPPTRASASGSAGAPPVQEGGASESPSARA